MIKRREGNRPGPHGWFRQWRVDTDVGLGLCNYAHPLQHLWRASAVKTLTSSLCLNNYEGTNELTTALCSRGWDGGTDRHLEKHANSRRHTDTRPHPPPDCVALRRCRRRQLYKVGVHMCSRRSIFGELRRYRRLRRDNSKDSTHCVPITLWRIRQASINQPGECSLIVSYCS